MAEQEQGDSFSASPEVAATILNALGHDVQDEVSGFAFGELMPRVKAGQPPLRPKDAMSDGKMIRQTQAAWTTWQVGG